jgi:shikimate dehydrogenase
LGSPIAHSLSPALHRAAYAALGLTDWSYEAIDMTADRLPAWLAGLDASWVGLSITMPLKRVILGLVDHVDGLAKTVGVANTVVFNPAGAVAANTDVYGIVAAIREAAPGRVWRAATVLGGGATAAAALAALAELGVAQPKVFVRSLARSQELIAAAARMGVKPELRRWPTPGTAHRVSLGDWPAELVISTLPPHAADALAAEPWGSGADGIGRGEDGPGRLGAGGGPGEAVGGNGADGIGRGEDGGVLLDVAYAPWPSRLAQAWAARGGIAVPGRLMLLHQAAEQVRLMTGRPAPLDAMRAAQPG